jgi:hypothetical protein
MKLMRVALLAGIVASILATPQAFGGANGGVVTGGGGKGGFFSSKTYSISCANGNSGTCEGGLSTCCAICSSMCGGPCGGVCPPPSTIA